MGQRRHRAVNLRNALLREIDFSTPKARGLAERKATAVLATGAQLMGHVRPGYSMLAATTLARMGGRMPVAHTVHVPDASIHRVSAGGLLADPVHGPRTPIWARHADGNPDPLALYRKEHVHARGLPAGV